MLASRSGHGPKRLRWPTSQSHIVYPNAERGMLSFWRSPEIVLRVYSHQIVTVNIRNRLRWQESERGQSNFAITEQLPICIQVMQVMCTFNIFTDTK